MTDPVGATCKTAAVVLKTLRALGITLSVVAASACVTLGERRLREEFLEVCWPEDNSPAAIAHQFHRGPRSERTLVRLSHSTDVHEADCGVGGLVVTDSARAPEVLLASLGSPGFRGRVTRLLSWATQYAARPDPNRGTAMLPMLDAVLAPERWASTGLDGVRFLGSVDQPRAREALLRELEKPGDAERIDTVVAALAQQGEAGAKDRVEPLLRTAVARGTVGLSSAETRRLNASLYYFLAGGSELIEHGARALGAVPAAFRLAPSFMALQTLCERATRRPSQKTAIFEHRKTLVATLDDLDVRWRGRAPQGNFPCIWSPGNSPELKDANDEGESREASAGRRQPALAIQRFFRRP